LRRLQRNLRLRPMGRFSGRRRFISRMYTGKRNGGAYGHPHADRTPRQRAPTGSGSPAAASLLWDTVSSRFSDPVRFGCGFRSGPAAGQIASRMTTERV
jgi:hypothetical protein